MLSINKTSRYTYRRGTRAAKPLWQRRSLLAAGMVAVAIVALIAAFHLGGFDVRAILRMLDKLAANNITIKINTAIQPTKPALPPLTFNNAVEQKVVTELRTFTTWLETNHAAGFIGEYGWPSGSEDWDRVAQAWFKEASYHDLWTTAWAAGSKWGDYPLAIYSQGTRESTLTPHSQAIWLEQFTPKVGQLKGVNLAGMEFSVNDNFNNTNPGIAGKDYFYEPPESLVYLAHKGYPLIRLPIRWERIQPTLNGDLRQQEVDAIASMLDAAAKNNLKVVLDLHNYGEYRTKTGKLILGSPNLTQDHLANLWLRLSQAFKNHAGLGGYGLMNEPRDFPAGNRSSPAKNWEAISQHTLTQLRTSGDSTLVLIAGYDWSSLARWPQTHPTPWITDPANNFRYEAHHYWSKDGSGYYQTSFREELQRR